MWGFDSLFGQVTNSIWLIVLAIEMVKHTIQSVRLSYFYFFIFVVWQKLHLSYTQVRSAILWHRIREIPMTMVLLRCKLQFYRLKSVNCKYMSMPTSMTSTAKDLSSAKLQKEEHFWGISKPTISKDIPWRQQVSSSKCNDCFCCKREESDTVVDSFIVIKIQTCTFVRLFYFYFLTFYYSHETIRFIAYYPK